MAFPAGSVQGSGANATSLVTRISYPMLIVDKERLLALDVIVYILSAREVLNNDYPVGALRVAQGGERTGRECRMRLELGKSGRL